MTRKILAGDTACVVDNVSVVSTRRASQALKTAYYDNVGLLVSSEVNATNEVEIIPFDAAKQLVGVLTCHGFSNDCVNVASKDTAITVITDEVITDADIGKPLYASVTGSFTTIAALDPAVAYILSKSTEVDGKNVAIARLALTM